MKAQTHRLNLTAHSVMTLYIKDDVDRAVQLLPYWEDNPPVAHELLGIDWVKLLIWDLREYLNNIGCLRQTPPDWTDPFNYGQYMDAKHCQVENYLIQQLQAAATSKKAAAGQESRLQQGLAALPNPDPPAIRASFVLALMSLGPLDPPPPGKYTKARSRRVQKRRAKEYLRLEALGLREWKRPKVFPPLELSEEADVGAARDQRGPGDSFGSEGPLVDPTPPHDTASYQVDQPPPPSSTQPWETLTVTLITAKPQEPQPSTSRAAYGTEVFARLGPQTPVVPLEIDSSDEDLEKYSPGTPDNEIVEEEPPQRIVRPILRSPSRTVRIAAPGDEPSPRRRLSYAEEVLDNAGGRAPVNFEPPPGRKKLTSKRVSRRLDRMPPWERRFYDVAKNYRVKGYTPPGSYKPPENHRPYSAPGRARVERLDHSGRPPRGVSTYHAPKT